MAMLRTIFDCMIEPEGPERSYRGSPPGRLCQGDRRRAAEVLKALNGVWESMSNPVGAPPHLGIHEIDRGGPTVVAYVAVASLLIAASGWPSTARASR